MEKMRTSYLGIDAGSVGIKMVLVDENEEVINTHYARNRGISETVHEGLEAMSNNTHTVKGVGTTGSGRNFVGMLAGADVVKTEILAHTIGTLHYHPDVRTILDIGGEDCKIMSVRNSILENFVMNSVCGAGTGAVIDSIATRMGISIEDVGEIALSHNEKLNFPGKCGVFTQSSVVSRLNTGAAKNNILMGVIRALASNYLMLGKGINLEPPYVFQGATSQNSALVFALEEQLNHPITIPKYAPFMGAIGIALMAKAENLGESKFRGYDLQEQNFNTRTVQAGGCENKCELTFLYQDGQMAGCIGNRCDNCYPKALNEAEI
ncbi:2-hydroxyglutaryl-CoA dehydratase [Candidatus Pacearchaeota archaeon]|nr:2-hydroxyglutaryl-CoA dehydratase [Candidatus Pacearchaeota archaeon]|tara:strand:- start:1056 stop:2021 length:966 start_codon:yes stop_codon:yes gene_type:complete